MPNDQRLTLNDVQYETERFLTPSTEKERDILSAAADLLGERGVDGATTAEIAKRAGVTERTLFRYFPAKADLVRRVLAPVILRTLLTREWKPFGALLADEIPDAKDEAPMFVPERMRGIGTNPALAAEPVPMAEPLHGRLVFGGGQGEPQGAQKRRVCWVARAGDHHRRQVGPDQGVDRFVVVPRPGQ